MQGQRSMGSSRFVCLVLAIWLLGFSCHFTAESLKQEFYSSTCRDAERIVESTVRNSVDSDPSIAASLVRLHYHDCFVQGCDGSVLVEGSNAEKTAPTHTGLRGFEVIESAKQKLESQCPGIVSCADIVALAARDAVALTGGPSYRIPTGRRDGLVSSPQDASNMPDPTDSIDVLRQKFAAKKLNERDLVVLNVSIHGYFIAAHTIGTAACAFVKDRLYSASNGPSINPDYVDQLEDICPVNGGDDNRVDLDRGSSSAFDNQFLNNVKDGNGVLQSDAAMYDDPSTSSIIDSYLSGFLGILGPPNNFADDFANSMIRLGQVDVKTSPQNSKIRNVCSRL